MLRSKKNKRPIVVVRARRVTMVRVGPGHSDREVSSLVGHAHKHMRSARKVVKA